jgi:hypothetical protein
VLMGKTRWGAIMKMTPALRKRANDHGLTISRYTRKTTLVRLIQKKEGQNACFRTDNRINCAQACEWSGDCIHFLIASWRR